MRKVTFYDCCPNSPYPTLLYQIVFERSSAYYAFKLVIPSISLSLLSFSTFWSKFSPRAPQREARILCLLALPANLRSSDLFARALVVTLLLLCVCNRSETGDRREAGVWHNHDSRHARPGYHGVEVDAGN